MKKRFSPLLVLLPTVMATFTYLDDARAEVSPQTLKSISTPSKVQTPVGKLEFFDGVPTDATVDTLYDNLDRMRAVSVFLDNVGALSVYSVIAGNAAIGLSQPNQIAVAEKLLDSHSLYLTGNTSTMYSIGRWSTSWRCCRSGTVSASRAAFQRPQSGWAGSNRSLHCRQSHCRRTARRRCRGTR